MRMRDRCRGRFSPEVALVIARNYDLLLRLCKVSVTCGRGSVEGMDIFHDTILMVTHDLRCLNFRSDSDFIEYFQYRYRMVLYQTCADEKQYNPLFYAHDLKTTENQEE